MNLPEDVAKIRDEWANRFSEPYEKFGVAREAYITGFDAGFHLGQKAGVRAVVEFLRSEKIPVCEASALYAEKHFAGKD